MPFRDGNFTQLTAHVRKDIDGSECFSCMVGEQYPAIASGCQIYPRQDVAAGEMAVSVKRTDGPFGTIAGACVHSLFFLLWKLFIGRHIMRALTFLRTHNRGRYGLFAVR